MKKKKIISLFSGCGGMDLGFEGGFTTHEHSINQSIHPEWIDSHVKYNWVKLKQTSFMTSFANDIRLGAKSAWVPYFQKRGNIRAEEVFHLDSIVELVKRAKNGGGKLFGKKIDLITGGFPCQDFSVAGKRGGFSSSKNHLGTQLDENDDPTKENRGMLYMWMREVINIVQPKMFIAENVKGLVSLKDAKEIIEKDFRNIGDGGYLVVPAKILNAGNYGVPQNRERVFFYGFRKKSLKNKALKQLNNFDIHPDYDPYPRITHFLTRKVELNNSENLREFVPVKMVLSDLLEPIFASDLSQKSYSKAKWYGKHVQGQTEIDLDGLAPTIRSEHHGNIEFRRLNKRHGGKNLNELKKGWGERRLTVRECARIQTFPDDYEFVRKLNKANNEFNLSGSEAYKLIGNAVPPLLAFNIAMRLESIWSRLFRESK